jgi:T5SS/PEP-CTERM-associated repeat protein
MYVVVRTARIVASVAAVGLIASAALAAVTTNWNTDFSGLFNNSANWDNGVPGSADTAVFDRGGGVTLTATFNGTGVILPPPVFEVDKLIVRSNTVSFARGPGVNGPSFIADHDSVAGFDSSIVVGPQAGDSGTLTTAIPITAASASIGEAAGSVATVNIPSSSWTLTASVQFEPTLIVGNRGFGILSMSGGAQLHLTGVGESLIIGNQAGSGGGVVVSDAGTAIVMEHGSQAFFYTDLFVGGAGAGELSITGGGMVTDDNGDVGGAGQVFVDGTNSLWSNEREVQIGAPQGEQTAESQGSLVVTNGGVLQATLGVIIHPSGTLGGNSQIICGVVSSHQLSTLENDGVIAPGSATGTIIGRLDIFGNLQQTSTGHIQIQIAGRSGAQYDQLSVNGTAQLGGALDVTLSNFSPQAGDEFNILDFNFPSGTFSSVNLPALAAGLSWDTSQLNAKGILSVTGPHLAGDYNHDGVVDAADYTVWRDTLGSKTSLVADGNANGVIDAADYDVWKAHFGEHAGSGSGSAATVPEPATLAMALIGAIALAGRRRARMLQPS